MLLVQMKRRGILPLAILSAAVVLATQAQAAGSGMPWEEPLQQVLESVQGPVAKIIAVNYRKRGRYYVVDRLFEAAELRLGGKRQQVVRIMRAADAGSNKRRGRAS